MNSVSSTDPSTGALLKRAREAADLTQIEAAKILGISKWTYIALENGRGHFHYEWLDLLPAGFGKDGRELVAGQQTLIAQRHPEGGHAIDDTEEKLARIVGLGAVVATRNHDVRTAAPLRMAKLIAATKVAELALANRANGWESIA